MPPQESPLSMSVDTVISVENISKTYRIWDSPSARLMSPILGAMAGLLPKQSGLAKRLFKHSTDLYRDFYALRNVSFTVKKGESIGIIGRNGSGKSTLLQIITGTLQASTGQVKINGRIAALLELGSGFNPEFTGRENVYLNGAVLGLSKQEIDGRFDRIASFADIGEFIEQPVKTYSSGMLLRLAFAVQIQVEPDILIVDEALSVGDEPFQRKCFGQIALMQERGVTILFVSHAAATIMDLCQRVVLLDHGECLLVAKPKAGLQHYHQLCYAPAARLAHVRSEILRAAAEPAETTESVRPQTEIPPEQSRAYFIESLISVSRSEFPPCGALIESIQLLDSGQRPVNVLVKGDEYTLRAQVRFTGSAKRVRFGWSAKGVTGVVLSGVATHPLGDGFDGFAAGSVVEVCFSLHCLFNPGSYFIDLLVRAEAPEPNKIIHGVVDALIFKVQPIPWTHRNGSIDISGDPAWSAKPISP